MWRLLAVGANALITLAMNAIRPGGRVCLFAQTQHGEAPFDPAAVCMDEKTLMGSYSSSVAIQDDAIQLVFDGYRDGSFDLTRLISHRFSLEDAVKGIDLASHPVADSMKIVIPALIACKHCSSTIHAQGGRTHKRAAIIATIAEVLRSGGYQLQIAATTSRSSAGEQVKQAIASGAKTIFACGGDGTVHDVIQGIAGTDVTLAVIPMGSANALCRELHIPMDSVAAAKACLTARPQLFALGRCTYANDQRFFLTLAGAGPDGALIYAISEAGGKRWGRWTYALHALRLLFRSRFHTFPVRYCDAVSGLWHRTEAVSAIAMRVSSLGGVFPGIARGASLREPKLRLALVKKPAFVGLPLWFVMNWLGLDRLNPLLEIHSVTACEFLAIEQRVHVQADGEWLGHLPTRMEILSQNIHILVPDR